MGGAGNPGGLLASAISTALSRAYPNPLPSNTVVSDVSTGQAAVDVGSTATLQATPLAAIVWGGPFMTWTIPGVVVLTSGTVWGAGQWR